MSKNLERLIESELSADDKFIESMGLRESLTKLKQQPALENSMPKNSLDNKEGKIVNVNGIPSHWTETMLLKFFDKYLTKIQHVKLLKNTLGHKTRNCLIHFDTDLNAEEFVNKFDEDWINTPTEQYHLKCSIFTLRKNQNKIRIINRKRQVMVYNLAWEAKEVDIVKIAQEFGTVEDFQMPFISRKKNKGYCLITFEKEKQANFFVESNQEMTLFGRELKFKQQHFIINTTYDKPSENYYDKVIANAESGEIFIRGALEKFGLEWIQGKEKVLYSGLGNLAAPNKVVGQSQWHVVKMNKNWKPLAMRLQNKILRQKMIRQTIWKKKKMDELMKRHKGMGLDK